jgi:hypothetical protein
LLRSGRWVMQQFIAYRDKKVVGVFVRFRAPLQASTGTCGTCAVVPTMHGASDRTLRWIPLSENSECE